MHRFFSQIAIVILLAVSSGVDAQRYLGYRPTDSGGRLMSEQAAYDVTFYDLNLTIQPSTKSISGFTEVRAKVVSPIEWFVLDLDARMKVTKVELIDSNGAAADAHFERRGNQIRTHLMPSKQPGETVRLALHYSGQPLEAPAPPWVGGFTWARTEDGSHWIATSMQFDGADLWIPCKDHPSDEPDSVAINITIPAPLYLASNGSLRGITANKDGTRTFHWFHSNPINNYNIALNIAPYKIIESTYESLGGEKIPLLFYTLPEHYDQAQKVFPQFAEHLRFYEEYLGPYPFRADKYSVAETPHLGMEHQTVIAYGRFRNNQWGYDELHHHELGHEWWGNMVSALDWRDFWLHEGFCAYMQALYNEYTIDEDAYHEFFATRKSHVRNITTLAPRAPTTSNERYFVAPEFIESDGDIYTKGALILHTLRYLIGKEALLKALRRFAYPTAELEKITDGRQCRFATTDDFLALVEDISGVDLHWYFEVYLRQPVLPRLEANEKDGKLHLRWVTPKELPFPMPVEVKIGTQVKRVVMPNGEATITLNDGESWEVDPQKWIYKWGD